MHKSAKKSHRRARSRRPRRLKRSKRRSTRRLKRSKRRSTRRLKRSKRRSTRRHRVHSKAHGSKKKPSPKFSGPASSRHHSSKKAGKNTHLKSPTISTRLKPAGRGRTLSRERARVRAKEREMDKLLHGLGGMKLSSAAHKKVDRLDDILHNLQGLDVRSLAEQRSSKLKARKKRFSFDQDGIQHIASALRERGPEGILQANRLEYFFRQYIRGRGYSPHGLALVSEAKAAIDDIINNFEETAAPVASDWQSSTAPQDDTVWGRAPMSSEDPDLNW